MLKVSLACSPFPVWKCTDSKRNITRSSRKYHKSVTSFRVSDLRMANVLWFGAGTACAAMRTARESIPVQGLCHALRQHNNQMKSGGEQGVLAPCHGNEPA
jgi:hypothetical protein